MGTKKIENIYTVLEFVNNETSSRPFLTLRKKDVENYILLRKKRYNFEEQNLQIDFNKLNQFGVCQFDCYKTIEENKLVHIKWKIYSKNKLEKIKDSDIMDDNLFVYWNNRNYKLALFMYEDNKLGIGLCDENDTNDNYKILHKITTENNFILRKKNQIYVSDDWYGIYSLLLVEDIVTQTSINPTMCLINENKVIKMLGQDVYQKYLSTFNLSTFY